MVLYVPGTEETDPKKQNMSLQQIGGATSTNTTNIATNTANIATNTANIASNTAAIAALPAPASQAEQETATDTSKPVTPGRQQYHPSASKAWVKFAGSAVNGAQTINASYNVSGVSRTGAGLYTVSFTTAFSSADYAVAGSAFGAALFITQMANGTQAAGSVGVVFSNAGGAGIDPVGGYLVAFGDQ